MTAIVSAIQLTKHRIEAMPLDEVGEPVKLMLLINHVVQAVAEEVDIRGESRLIGTHFCSGNCKESACHYTKTGNFKPLLLQ